MSLSPLARNRDKKAQRVASHLYFSRLPDVKCNADTNASSEVTKRVVSTFA